MNDKEYEEKDKKLETKLKPFLTDEFLSTLIKTAKTCGWSIDHIESINLIFWCFDVAGKEQPKHDDLTPFMDE